MSLKRKKYYSEDGGRDLTQIHCRVVQLDELREPSARIGKGVPGLSETRTKEKSLKPCGQIQSTSWLRSELWVLSHVTLFQSLFLQVKKTIIYLFGLL